MCKLSKKRCGSVPEYAVSFPVFAASSIHAFILSLKMSLNSKHALFIFISPSGKLNRWLAIGISSTKVEKDSHQNTSHTQGSRKNFNPTSWLAFYNIYHRSGMVCNVVLTDCMNDGTTSISIIFFMSSRT